MAAFDCFLDCIHPAHDAFITRTCIEKREYCGLCRYRIGDGWLCSYGCPHDTDPPSLRPAGTVLQRTFEVTEKLVSSRINQKGNPAC